MKCPECIKQGLRSTVRGGLQSSTLMAFHPWYDEDGNYHSHDGNILTSTYTCSRGHQWIEKTNPKCPQGDYP